MTPFHSPQILPSGLEGISMWSAVEKRVTIIELIIPRGSQCKKAPPVHKVGRGRENQLLAVALEEG